MKSGGICLTRGHTLCQSTKKHVSLYTVITHLGSYSPVMGLHSIVRYDKKIIINNRPIRSDYGVSIISKWAHYNGPVLELCWWVEPRQFQGKDSNKALTHGSRRFLFRSLKAWWVPYSNMISITCLIKFVYNLWLCLCVAIIVTDLKTYM